MTPIRLRYFDAIPHDRALGLINGFLTQGVLEHTGWTEAEEGPPQGGVICRIYR